MKVEEILSPQDIKGLSINELNVLSEDIRKFLIEHIAKTGGHLSSNLGVVEITMAMHYVFNSPEDKLIFDVGHQCYTHKILTGRAKEFTTLRQFNGLSGFINQEESVHDIWESGHSSTSLSAQCGYLLANKDKNHRVVALIGDSSLTNGAAFEGLNYMGAIKDLNPIIILNDNNMSISKAVGASSRYLSRIRQLAWYQAINNFFAKHSPHGIRKIFHTIKTGIKGMMLGLNIFEAWGYDYLGPYDGNDLELCIKNLKAAKNINKPVVIHIITKKGKGYSYAENDVDGTFHGIGPFDIATGKTLISSLGKSYSEVMADKLVDILAKQEAYILTPAMLKGSALLNAKKLFPQNVIDVGIAEEHACVMASALSECHKKVYLMLYSTFSQRGYDFILNDICRKDKPVTICLDRSDIVKEDGPTHQGIYDINMFASMPNIIVSQPSSIKELNALMDYSLKCPHPLVIRYPKVTVNEGEDVVINDISWTKVKEGKDLTIVSYGEHLNYIEEALKDSKIDYSLINARFIIPGDTKMMEKLIKEEKPILIYENCVKGTLINEFYALASSLHQCVKIEEMGLDRNASIPCGDVENIKKMFNLDKASILKKSKQLVKD